MGYKFYFEFKKEGGGWYMMLFPTSQSNYEDKND